MPSPAQYKDKIQAYTEGKDPLAMQSDSPRIIAELIAGISETALRQRPFPNKWSVVEIIAHLAEDELTSSWRYRQMIENSGCSLAGFDQDEWARLGDYASWKPAEALQMFRLLREANLRMLRRLTADEWERFGVHAERGRITVKDLALHMAGHDMNHVEQIRAILAKS
jgi:DinB family protein